MCLSVCSIQFILSILVCLHNVYQCNVPSPVTSNSQCVCLSVPFNLSVINTVQVLCPLKFKILSVLVFCLSFCILCFQLQRSPNVCPSVTKTEVLLFGVTLSSTFTVYISSSLYMCNVPSMYIPSVHLYSINSSKTSFNNLCTLVQYLPMNQTWNQFAW